MILDPPTLDKVIIKGQEYFNSMGLPVALGGSTVLHLLRHGKLQHDRCIDWNCLSTDYTEDIQKKIHKSDVFKSAMSGLFGPTQLFLRCEIDKSFGEHDTELSVFVVEGDKLGLYPHIDWRAEIPMGDYKSRTIEYKGKKYFVRKDIEKEFDRYYGEGWLKNKKEDWRWFHSPIYHEIKKDNRQELLDKISRGENIVWEDYYKK